jgi:hypothetical protein
MIMTCFQVVITIVNIIAVMVAPAIAVVITQKLQDRADKRKDKLQIFKILMTARIYGWTIDSVHALNVIDIVFSDDNDVRSSWKDLNDKYHTSNPDAQHLKKIEQAQFKLLEAIANVLGYKDKITWETIQNPYIPDGFLNQLEAQKKSQQAYLEVLTEMSKMFPKESI